MNRTLEDKARTMLLESKLSKIFWGEAICTANYLTNRSPCSALSESKTPFEMWYGYKPNLAHLVIFGSTAFAHIPKQKRKKLDCRSEKCIFMGYAPNGYRLWNNNERKIIIRHDVVFNESFDDSFCDVYESFDDSFCDVFECKTKFNDAGNGFINSNDSCKNGEKCINDVCDNSLNGNGLGENGEKYINDITHESLNEDVLNQSLNGNVLQNAYDTMSQYNDEINFESVNNGENIVVSSKNKSVNNDGIAINNENEELDASHRKSTRVRRNLVWHKDYVTEEMALVAGAILDDIPQNISDLKKRADWDE